MPFDSILGALRDRILTDDGLRAAVPGGVHDVELPSDKALSFPAVVLRYKRTDYDWMMLEATTSPSERVQNWVEKPRVEVWAECARAAQGEALARQVLARVMDQPLSLSFATSVQVFPVDFFLADGTGRNARGERQYSFCLLLELWLSRTQTVTS